jgi:GH15 family glucan-1,4-alpha-glucosidase
MARDLPIGNGNVLINFDTNYNLRDIYYPYVGQENQALDHLSHFGVWVEEGFAWIDDPELNKTRQAKYLEDSLVTDVACSHERLGWDMQIRDTVDCKENIFIRKIKLSNHWNKERKVKLFFHLDLRLNGNAVGDTVYFDPELRSLIFYKGHRYLSLSSYTSEHKSAYISAYAIGQKAIHGMQGTWRDAEDGNLGGNPIAQGSVDGTAQLDLTLHGGQDAEAWFWICFGRNIDDIVKLEQDIRKATPRVYMQRTHDYWHQWVNRDAHDLRELPENLCQQYKRSLLIIRTNMDNRGAIIAANDSDILKFAKDTYSYLWPRDGALISHALDRSGYYELTRRFFQFCRRVQSKPGYLMHKYNPDGSVGSSWHPWVNGQDEKQLPIQEDETALVLYSLWHHYRLSETLGQSLEDYQHFVIPAADFMLRYRDASGLPLPSYDLWEERYGVMAFTVAAVYAGLLAASNFAEYHRDTVRMIHYRDTANRMKKAVENQLVFEKDQRFVRGLFWNSEKKVYEPDLTLDVSMYALFDFQMFAPDDPRIVNTMKALRQRLWVQTQVGGMARYENDMYHQVSQDIGKVPGNPWFICTLWYAEWVVAVAEQLEELQEAEDCLQWAASHTLPSGVMAEQIHPYTGEPLSVSPLTWSHASFIKVIQEFAGKRKKLQGKLEKPKQEVSDDHILQTAQKAR